MRFHGFYRQLELLLLCLIQVSSGTTAKDYSSLAGAITNGAVIAVTQDIGVHHTGTAHAEPWGFKKIY